MSTSKTYIQTYLFLLLFLCYNYSMAQDVVLNTQAQVNNYNGDSVVNGNLFIDGNDITDLSPLSNITTVTGSFALTNCGSLTNVSGLSSLAFVDVEFTIAGNSALENLDGLENMSGEVEDLIIALNNIITNIDAISGINKVNDRIYIANNLLLETLDGLSGINGPQNKIELEFNLVLQNVDGLSNITGAGMIRVLGCDLLTNVDGLSNITGNLTNGLQILDNDLISNLDGLSGIENITTTFDIVNNSVLSDCCGIGYPLSISNGSFPTPTFSGNAAGCNSVTEVLEACFPIGCAGDVNLTTQAEVDAFVACDTFFGALSISGNDITDLSALSSLEAVVGRIFITNNPMLSSLNGLQNLNYVSSFINIVNNPLLTDLAELSNLSQVEGSLAVVNNQGLLTLTGLENYTGSEQLVILQNDLLINIDALSNVTSVTDFLYFDGNALLTNLNGLSNLTGSVSQINIENTALEDLSALSGIQVEGYWIIQNTALTSLNGLNLGTSTNGGPIVGNTALVDINVFDNVETLTGSMVFVQNDALTDCCSFAHLIDPLNTDPFIIEDNGLACSSVNEILQNCGIQVCVDLPTFTTQAQVDAFLGCEIIYGDLIIDGTDSDITDLSPFAGTQEVTGTLEIRGTNVSNLSGFQNLTSTSRLVIRDNEQLNEISALSNLGGELNELIIRDNPALNSIEDLSNVAAIIDRIWVFMNPSLNACCLITNVANNFVGPSSLAIYNNAPGCNNQIDIFDACSPNDPADLSLSISIDEDVLEIYSFYEVSLSITNNGPGIAINTIVDFPIPNGIAYSGTFDFPGSPDTYSDWLGEWKVGILQAGETRTLGITLFSLTESSPIDIFAEIKSDNQDDPDSTPGNRPCCTPIEDDEVVVTITPENYVPQESDLELTASLSQNVIQDGDNFTVQLSLTNNGPDIAEAIIIDLPNFFFNQSPILYDDNDPFSVSGGQIIFSDFWSIPQMLSGLTYTATLNYVAVDDLTGPYNLFFQVDSAIPNDPDSSPGNLVCDNPELGNCTANEDDEIVLTLTPASSQDVTPPTVILTTNNGVVNGPFNVNVIFDEPITGLTSNDFTVNNATGSGLSGSNSTYSLQITPTIPGPVSVTLPAAAVADFGGNGNLVSNTLSVTYTTNNGGDGVDLALSMSVDITEPNIYSDVTFTLNLMNAGLTDATGVTVLFPFPEELAYVSENTAFGSFDVFMRTWNVGNVPAGQTATLELTLFTLVEDEPILAFAQVQTIDTADEDSTPGNWTCDLTGAIPCIPNEDDEATFTLNVPDIILGPTVTLSTASNTVDAPFTVDINFSEMVTGLTMTDFSTTNGNVSNLSGSGANYSILVTPLNAGLVTISLPAGRATDTDGNANMTSNGLQVTYNPISNNGLDLELAFSSDETGFTLYDEITVMLTLTNNSSVDASNLVVDYPKPVGGAFVSQTISTGNYTDYNGVWTIGTLAAGGMAVLEVTWFTLTNSEDIINWAQVQTASPVDGDSTPGNGVCCTANEDDEAAITISPSATLNSEVEVATNDNEQFKNIVIEKLFPNPATDQLQLYLTSLLDNESIQLFVYDLLGNRVMEQEVILSEGFNRVSLDIQSLSAGNYNIVLSDNKRHNNIRFVKIRM